MRQSLLKIFANWTLKNGSKLNFTREVLCEGCVNIAKLEKQEENQVSDNAQKNIRTDVMGIHIGFIC